MKDILFYVHYRTLGLTVVIAKITKDLFLRVVFLDWWRVREAKIVEKLTIFNILRNLCSSIIIYFVEKKFKFSHKNTLSGKKEKHITSR